MTNPAPSLGRIVHYQNEHSNEPHAALITGVDDSFGTNEHPETRVSLRVFTPFGEYSELVAPFAEEPTPGHWNWPPRV